MALLLNVQYVRLLAMEARTVLSLGSEITLVHVNEISAAL